MFIPILSFYSILTHF